MLKQALENEFIFDSLKARTYKAELAPDNFLSDHKAAAFGAMGSMISKVVSKGQ